MKVQEFCMCVHMNVYRVPDMGISHYTFTNLVNVLIKGSNNVMQVILNNTCL